MTRNLTWRLAAVCGAVLALSSVAPAQYNPYPTLNPGSRFATYARNTPYVASRQPQLSPYLNMLRGGNPAANYFLGVVPEQQRRRFEAATIAGLSDLEQRSGTATTGDDNLFPRLSQTGHPVQYLNPAPYYNMGTGRSAGQGPQPFQGQARPKR